MGNTWKDLWEREKVRSALFFWTPVLVLILFFIRNQAALWTHYLEGETALCVGCAIAVSGMEIVWMYFPLMGTYATWPTMSLESKRLFRRYLKPALILLPLLTVIKISLRFSLPESRIFWIAGAVLECDWIYISLTNLGIWIALNWRAESKKVEKGLSIAQKHCVVAYGIPALLIVLSVTVYRTIELSSNNQLALLTAMSFCELIYVLSPLKTTISWHFRP